jgi:hypothetical protein
MNIPLRSLLATLALFATCAATVIAAPRLPMREAAEHLERVRALLEQPAVAKPMRHEVGVSRHLSQALANLEQSKENKGSQLPLAIKAVKAAQSELEGKDDAASRAKALAHVNEALERIEKAWKNKH